MAVQERDLETGLSFIDTTVNNPLGLFAEWFAEAENSGHLQPNAFCLSTSTSDGKVHARHLLMRDLEDDGLIIVTDRTSSKAAEIKGNPNCAATFFWTYVDKNGSRVSRQARLQCIAYELEPDKYQSIYDKEPLYCKIRSHICKQGKPVKWEELKDQHDQLYLEFKEGRNTLQMPQCYIGYKLVPTMGDFYHARDNFIADRLCFTKEVESNQWKSFHVAA